VNNPKPAAPASDDTVEFQLSEADMLGLAQAADAAQPQSADPFPVVMAPKLGVRVWGDVAPSPQQPRKTIVGWAGAAAVYAAFMLFAWWGVAAIPNQQTPPLPVATTPKPVIHQSVISASPAPATVQVRNPFDATEVFEFPAGTSETECREKVAKLLWQRANERRAQWAHIKSKANLRMAKN
jgi:hypothetical protein